VLVPIAALVLIVGMKRSNRDVSQVALSLLIIAALVIVPAFLLGEGAEEIVEHREGVSHDVIHEHEEAGEFALWVTIAAGVVSVAALAASAKEWRHSKRAMAAALVLALLSTSSLFVTAQKGGMIRHPEAFEPAPSNARQSSN
jgi:formate hydrogenlyase subunit 3/multisubunit Na+/H+ antiporter MnhD subunit